MSSRQVAEWLAFNAIEPIGEVRGDLRAGIIASTIVNVNKKRGSVAAKAEDYMPDFDRVKDEDLDPKEREEKIHKVLMGMVQVQKEKERREEKNKQKRKDRLVAEGKWDEKAEAKKEEEKIAKMKKKAFEEAKKLRAQKLSKG